MAATAARAATATPAGTWTTFKLPNGDTGYSMKNPKGGGYLYHGPDGKIYPTPGPNQQEAPGTAAISSVPVAAKKPAAPAAAVTPAYIAPSAVPQLQAQTIGNIPSVDGTGIMNSSGLSTEDLSGGDFAKSIMGMLAPQFAQQQHQMNESLASAGISGGSTAGAQTELANSQNAQTQGLLQPELLQLLGLQNTRDTTVASDQLQAATTNQGANQSAQEFNAGQNNTAGSFNIGKLLQTASGNQSAYNNFLANLQQQQEQTYLGNLGAVSGQAQTGQGIGTTRQPVYTQPSYTGMNFGSALGSLGGGTNATAQAGG